MGNWNFLGGILEEVHIHSTIIGKIWLTVLFIFRMLVLGVAAEDVWNDEQSGFICNTEQPGCRNVCYDQAFPISLVRYWVLQVIFVSSPSLVYMGHALYRLRVLEKERQRRKAQLRGALGGVGFEVPGDRRRLEQELCQLEQRKLNKAPLRGTLLCTYVVHIFTRSMVEVGFMIGQYLLYGFHLQPLFKCHGHPCPNVIDCFVSRPTEKTIFLLFMQSIATVSLFLNVLEIFHLGFKKIKRGLWGQYKLKDEHNEFFANKSKQNLAKYQSTSANSLKGFSSAPDYYLLMEKQKHPAACPSLSSPAFQADPDNHSGNDEKCILDEQETVLSDEMRTLSATCSHLQHISSCNNEDTHKIFRREVGTPLKEKREMACKDGKRNHCSRGHCSIPGVAIELDNHMGQSSQTAFPPPAQGAWEQSWLSTTWGPSPEEENQGSPPKGNLKGQCREGTIRTLPPSQGDCQAPDISDTPDSLGQLTFDSDLVRGCNNPTACPPNHLVLLTNHLTGRRAPTDLQI
ncbi:gap junction alpha-9 protein [Canis lupus familiaris]|uniref:Gap junction protein n=1 Tax=Canis lupus familiaris TaxID=9615 RepID=A0A654IFD0_CANLF|nr:gap junction alpha-9 protein [Canis lupus familiaris]XP_038413758.1 gap junction alpha-9 protein [Canis lupus familiaris]VZP20310.1 TPA: connexin M [Canis lupus familiaris]|eukprot:XP_005628978.1 gap junction alpha-9 protein [Canis lupus familiaris]